MSWIFTSGGQSIGVSASASFLPMNILELISFRIDWFDPLAVRDSQESSPAPWFESISSLVLCLLYGPTVIYMYMTTGKTIALTIGNFVGKVMSLLFNMLSRFVIAFLPRSKCLLIPYLQSLSTVILEPKKIKSATHSLFSHLFAVKYWGHTK